MNLGLSNKKVLVTGSSRGIGLVIAKGFLREGAKVVFSSRNQKELDLCKEKLINENYSSQILSIRCDFIRPKELSELKQQIIEKWKGLDIIVANVGSGESVSETIADSKHWNYVFSLN